MNCPFNGETEDWGHPRVVTMDRHVVVVYKAIPESNVINEDEGIWQPF
jgi:hypothetical protein